MTRSARGTRRRATVSFALVAILAGAAILGVAVGARPGRAAGRVGPGKVEPAGDAEPGPRRLRRWTASGRWRV